MPEKPAPATATILEKVMSKYTAEQVDSAIREFAGYSATHHGIGNDLLAIADDYAILLRERESANEAVTDGWPEYVMLRDTKLHDDSGGLGQHIYTTAGAGYEKRKYILEAVAPMLASARVPVGDVDFTSDEVGEAMEMLRKYRSSIPTECIDQMERVLLAAAPKPETEGER